MSHGAVTIRIHDTDEATWETLAKVFVVKTVETTTWIELIDRDTDISVAFFKPNGLELGPIGGAEPAA